MPEKQMIGIDRSGAQVHCEHRTSGGTVVALNQAAAEYVEHGVM
jgi:hypothetical protein